MPRTGKWEKYSDLELLNMLKAEIVRIGIEDHPSRTKYQKLYNRANTPSPSLYMQRFGVSWEKIIASIGFDISTHNILRVKAGAANGRKAKGIKKKNSKWNRHSNEELFEVVRKEVVSKNIKYASEYGLKRNTETSPSESIVRSRLGSLKGVIDQINNERN